jgi:hypothetical protein
MSAIQKAVWIFPYVSEEEKICPKKVSPFLE